MWTLPVPFVVGGTAVLRQPNEAVTISTNEAPKSQAGQAVLQPYQPTLMERWLVTGLWLPMSVQGEGSVPETPINMTLGVSLLYGGDIVWSEARELQGFTNAQNRKYLIVAESLPQPVEVMRGRVLELQASLSSPAKTNQLSVAFSFAAGPGAVGIVQNGQLTYYSEKLAGHREL